MVDNLIPQDRGPATSSMIGIEAQYQAEGAEMPPVAREVVEAHIPELEQPTSDAAPDKSLPLDLMRDISNLVGWRNGTKPYPKEKSTEGMDYIDVYVARHALDGSTSPEVEAWRTQGAVHRSVPAGYPPLTGGSQHAITADKDTDGSIEDASIAQPVSGEPML